MNAVRTLQNHRLPFSAIAVLTAESLSYPEEIYHEFENLDVRYVGFNLEETEAGHVSNTLQSAGVITAYTQFMERIYAMEQQGSVRVREFESIRNQLIRQSAESRSVEATPLDIVSVDFEGNVATFSPELLGVETQDYGVFHFGNVATGDLEGLLDNQRFRRVASDIARGVAMCRESCEYFTLCGGGAPANKYYEIGSFATTETRHCATKIKSNTGIVLDRLEQATT